MNEIWANRLTAEPPTRTWDEVPASRKNAVKEVLKGRVESETITAEQYSEIVGEEYEA